MAAILVAYATGEGQTAAVADHVADVLASRGHDVTTAAIEAGEDSPDPGDSDAVVIGASVHGGRHQSRMASFVADHHEALAARPTAFFQLSLSSATEEGQAEAAGYVESFVDETGWHPDRIAQFGGALRFGEYGFLKRLMMKQIARRSFDELPEADAEGTIEFTDWDEVEAFANDVGAFVEGRLAVTPDAKRPE